MNEETAEFQAGGYQADCGKSEPKLVQEGAGKDLIFYHKLVIARYEFI